MGSVGQLIEGVIWNVVFAWIAAVIFGLVYNGLAPKA
jgi:cell shape-determining protein MreD